MRYSRRRNIDRWDKGFTKSGNHIKSDLMYKKRNLKKPKGIQDISFRLLNEHNMYIHGVGYNDVVDKHKLILKQLYLILKLKRYANKK